VTVESCQDQLASVRFGPFLLTLPRGNAREGAAELSVRPQALRLTAGSGPLSGSIAKAAYLGSHMEYWVTVDGLDRPLFVIAEDVEFPLSAGTVVAIAFARAGVALVSQG
jgi:iron(III) transport system ATP-binding protein